MNRSKERVFTLSTLLLLTLFFIPSIIESKKPVKVNTEKEKQSIPESNEVWQTPVKNTTEDVFIVPSSFLAPPNSLRLYSPKQVIINTNSFTPNKFWRHLTTFSVIIPTHNNAETIIDTLESVQKSIEYFALWYPTALLKEFGLTTQEVISKPWKGEVIVVDDCSTDNTVVRVLNFINSRIHSNTTNRQAGRAIWKCLSLNQNVKSGAARNFGVRATSGDVLFFIDGDDLYLQDHIFLHFYFLMKSPETSLFQSSISVDVPGIHPRWKARIENTHAMSKSMYRKLFHFIEGFPEQLFFQRHEDFAWASMLITHSHISTISKDTSVYVRYINNSLDRQVDKFRMSPDLEIKKLQVKGMDDVEEMEAREVLIKTHSEWLKKKWSYLMKNNKAEEIDPYWAVFQSSIESWGEERGWDIAIDIQKTAYKRWFAFAGAVAMAESTVAMEAAKYVYKMGENYVYDVKKHEETLKSQGFAVLFSSDFDDEEK